MTLWLFAFLVSFLVLNGKAGGGWLGISLYDMTTTDPLYCDKLLPTLIPPEPRSPVGTHDIEER